MDSDLKQAEILNQSRFTELKQVNARYMQNRNRKFAKQIDNTIITQDALLSAAKDYLSTKRKLSLACTMVINLLKLIIRSDSCGIACFRRLYLESPIAMELIKSGIRILVVCTQSNMQILPTPSYFTEVGTIMLWYSNNSIRIEKREKNPEPHLDFLGRDLVKIHYVWADSFARHLTDQASSLDVRVVGSIILNSLAAREQLDPTARIIVFDVTPFVGAGEDEYYNLENTSKFISDIVSSTQDLSRVIAIKPKRNYVAGNSKKSHDSKYVDLLISLQDQGKVQLLGPEADIYFEIGASSLVICIPLSSPALIAREMGVPVIYYNPDENSTWNLQNSYDGISLISGKKEIKSYLQTFN
jgi:polysaccharide biosynthesis PFTS motif protein